MSHQTKIIFAFCLVIASYLTPSYAQIRHKNQGNLKVIGSDTIQVDANNGDVIEALFPVKNFGTEILTISQIATECICFDYHYPEQGIQPEATDTIRLFFKTKNVPPGPYFKRVFADYDEGSIELILEGNLKIIRPQYKPNEKTVIYKPKQIVVRNEDN
jgi:hypothetical protein